MDEQRVTNQTLLVMLQGISDKGNDRHLENRERLLDLKQNISRVEGEWKETNGRLRNAERKVERHQWAIGVIGVIALALLYSLLAKYIHP